MANEILIIGGGGHAKVVVDSLLSQGHHVVGVVDSKYSGDLLGVARHQAYGASLYAQAYAIIAIGDNNARKTMSTIVSHPYAKLIDNTATVSSNASVDVGTMVLHRAVVQASAVIGKHVIINTGAQVDHDCVIADFVHVAPRAALCGSVKVGEGTLLGAGAVVLPGVTIGKWCIVAAGSVVTKNVNDFSLVAGAPAKFKKSLNG